MTVGQLGDWQGALSKATEELQRLPPLALTRTERKLAGVYIRQMEDALAAIAGSCPDCRSPLGARHHCGKWPEYRTYDEIGLLEGDPRRGITYFG